MRVRWAFMTGVVVAVCLGSGTLWGLPVTGQGSTCAREVLVGEIRAGQEYVKVFGNELEVRLEPLASGWVLRVLPVGGPRPAHDYAELATPPSRSVSPLLISTDFNFRAQDAVAWNPRSFRFAIDRHSFSEMSKAYDEYVRTPAPSTQARDRLVKLVSESPAGTVEILDARLMPGVADQTKAAALVASHFTTTAHILEQPADRKEDALGRLTWIRFRISMDVPTQSRKGHRGSAKSHPCM